MINRALFLDRDGVINVEKNYLYKIEDFEFIDGVFDSLHYFQSLGYLLIIITNQAGIGRGYYSDVDFYVLNNWMVEQFKDRGVIITKVYYCPYHPLEGVGEYKRESYYRKPNPGMILQAQKEYKINLKNSILVGDKDSDIEAGKNAGIGFNILVKTGHGGEYKLNSSADHIIESIKNLSSVDIHTAFQAPSER